MKWVLPGKRGVGCRRADISITDVYGPAFDQRQTPPLPKAKILGATCGERKKLTRPLPEHRPEPETELHPGRDRRDSALDQAVEADQIHCFFKASSAA